MLGPKQLEEIEKLKEVKMKQRAFAIKALNQGVYRHMMNSGQAVPTLAIDDEIELLELQPVSITSGISGPKKGGSGVSDYYSRINIPEVCKFTYCEPCNRIRPPRCEHCVVCDECVLRVDHHCFFVGNSCIGFNNQKFFILYCLYFSMGCFSIAGFMGSVMVG